MSERLTDKRIAHGGFIEYKNYDKFAELPNVREIYDRLCDLEDKIEQGKILELPCKVGQIVYEVQPIRARTQGYEITTVKWNGHYWWFTWVVKDHNGIYGNVDGFSSHQIGKTVFLDRASAEAKLREMEGDNNE